MTEMDSGDLFKELTLRGRSPREFLSDEVKSKKELVDDLHKQGYREEFHIFDLADLVLGNIQSGLITEQDVEESLDVLGIDEQSQANFIPRTLPEYQNLLELRAKQDSEKAARDRDEFMETYTQQWGFERLGNTADYFLSHQNFLEATKPGWVDRVKEFGERKEQTAEMLESIKNPRAKAQILMREAFRLTYFYPSEMETIFRTERETNSFVYLNSLLTMAGAISGTDLGHDPNDSKIDIGIGRALIIQANTPESLRIEAVDKMLFGARNPRESYTEGKPTVSRSGKGIAPKFI